MLLTYRGFAREPGSPLHEAMAHLRGHRRGRGGESAARPYLLGCAPVARMNPYQQLLYRGMAAQDIVTTPVLSVDGFDPLLAVRAETSGVGVHLHWLNPVLAGARDGADARARVDRFLERVDGFIDADGRVVWTVHNVLPHDAVHLEQERRLQQGVADRAHLIHVMHPDTADVLGESLRWDSARTVVAPHPSYAGAYPDTVRRDEARGVLGIHEDEVVYVALGAIKAYKGIDTLLDAFDQLCREDVTPRRLVVAGPADTSPHTRALVKRLRTNPRVLVQAGPVPGDRVQYLLRSADMAVLPHLRALNSGGALLGPTYGLPVLAARVGVLPAVLQPEFTEFFQDHTVPGMTAGLRAADRLLSAEARDAASDFARQHDPDLIGERFAQVLRARLWVA